MQQTGHILFFDKILVDYLFSHVALSKGITVTGGQSEERALGVSFRATLLAMLSAGGKLESAVKSETTISREITDLEILQQIWSTSELRSQIRDYRTALDDLKDGKQNRIVLLEGKLSWLPKEGNNAWKGDIVFYNKTGKGGQLEQILLLFGNPAYRPIVPGGLHGCNAGVVSLWEPYIYEQSGKQLRECKVIAAMGK